MPFIDWDGDGKIGPVDIGISIATENDENTSIPKNEKTKSGCLTSLLIVLSIVVLSIIFLG